MVCSNQPVKSVICEIPVKSRCTSEVESVQIMRQIERNSPTSGGGEESVVLQFTDFTE